MNRVTLVGRITKDPELKTSPSGVNFVSFSIAVNRNVQNANGERVADFINCVAFNKQAENLCRFIKKGGLIGVDGKLQSRTYQGNDGTTRYATDVVCDQVNFLEPKNSNPTPSYNNNDYSSYDNSFNQAPREVVNPTPVQPSYNQSKPSVFDQPKQTNNNNGFNDMGNQYTISDDDLPF